MLSGYVDDAESFDEVRRGFARTARTSMFHLEQYLVALEVVLAEPQPEGTLLRLVEGDASYGLDNPTDAGAAVVLRQISETLRTMVGSVEGWR
ncbi:hypothetical protein ACGFJ7_39645 [Actinoplanes sp. NPDC048988]|uniref:hypothetical protein n=1 Tax=Actinoplanes sp. NPDC048988 TaxID=3363901 RepID=UPI00371A8214